MKTVKAIIFRYLTNSDFFNIYKPKGTEAKGGGQSYIDIPNGSVSPENWAEFFSGIPSAVFSKAMGTWTADIYSIGLTGSQSVVFHQRRGKEFSITAQRLDSKESNRVLAWHPNNGFPRPRNPADRKSKPKELAIFLASTFEGEVWAGWFRGASPANGRIAQQLLSVMSPSNPRDGFSSYLVFSKDKLFLEETSAIKPFVGKGTIKTGSAERKESKGTKKTEDELLEELFNDDEPEAVEPRFRKLVRMVRIRNLRAVKNLKELYQGKCQITGEKFTFKKKDGTWYSEAHHLIPLGEQGSDSAFNLVVISPLLHRMLHLADVSKINLEEITAEGTLDITINGVKYTIKWHPKHVANVQENVKTSHNS